MSENVNKPEVGFRTQDELKLKVSDDSTPAGEEVRADAIDVDSGSALSSEQSHTSESLAQNSLNSPSLRNKAPSETSSAERLSESDLLTYAHSENNLQIHNSSTWGLRRHRLIMAACLTISISCLGLSTLDLRHLISTPAFVNDKLKVINVIKQRAELPLGYIYNSSTNDYGLLETNDGEIEFVSHKYTPVIKTNWDGNKFGFADSAGKIVIPAEYAQAKNFKDGLAAVSLGQAASMEPERVDTQKWGFIDEKGKQRIPFKYEAVGEFHNGAAVVSENGLWGLIDKGGEVVLKPQYRQISQLGPNYKVIDERDRVGIVSPKGDWILAPKYSRIESLGRSIFQFGWPIVNPNAYDSESDGQSSWSIREWGRDCFGVIDSSGQILIPMKYDEIVSYANGVAAVKVDGKIGFVNGKNEWLIKPQFEQASPYGDIIAVQEKAGVDVWTFVDKTGKPLSELTSKTIISDTYGNWLKHDRAVFSQNKKFGYLDSKGNIVIKPQFDFALPFEGNFAPIWNGSSWRFIDKSGNLMPGIFQYMSFFSNGGWQVSVQGPFFSFIEGPKIKDLNETIKSMLDQNLARRRHRGIR
ncbi:MAG: hypothetical protein C0507_00165 [Cyanobacteria bacterium PR.3.49]|nr:hypothetical protein [Cyanobacteria bacterium PR.3.49]